VEVVDKVLPVDISCNDVLGAAGEYHHSDNQKNRHDCPKHTLEDNEALPVQKTYQDEVTIEGHAGFLDLLIHVISNMIHLPWAGYANAYQPHHIRNCRSGYRWFDCIVSVECIITQSCEDTNLC
jgi:hypothetical protein